MPHDYLAYDTASSSSSSPPPLRHRLMRKRSPSPSSSPSNYVSNLCPHHYFAPSPRPYSPSSREADIARLLDPAYASPAPYSPLNKSPRMAVKEVYVDHHGDLHDPDFRDFPPFVHSHFQSRRPTWDRGSEDDDSDDDDESHVEQRRPSLEPRRRTPSSFIAYYPPPLSYPCDEPASYESRYLAEDEAEERENFERTPLKEKCFSRRPRSPPKPSKAQDEKQFPSTLEGDQVIETDPEWTPTCTQSLRRHWQAVALSIRFLLFRTKRRFRRRMTG